MPDPVTGAIIGGSLISGYLSKRAADKQVSANREAQQILMERSEPFRQAGESVLDPLTESALAGPNFDLAADRAAQDIQQLAAARGGLFSGGTLDALQRNRMEFEDLRQGQRFQQLFQLATMGGNASIGAGTNIANLQTSSGAAQAGGLLGIGNAFNSGLQSFLLMDLLKGQGG